MAVIRATDLAEYIAGRCKIYDAALEADLRRLRAAHGSSTVFDALRLLGQHADRGGFNQATADGVAKTLPSE